MPASRTPEQVRADIEEEREQLAGAVGHLRDSLGNAANISGKLRSKLPLVAGGAASAGFVIAGGIGRRCATSRGEAARGTRRRASGASRCSTATDG